MGFDVYAKFATDEAKECSGVEINIGPGAYVTVARLGNENYIKELTAKMDQYREQLELLKGTKEGEELDVKIAIEVEADTILLGFRGMDYQGKQLKYSRANAIKLLSLKEFRSAIRRIALNVENYRVKLEKAEEEK